MAAGRGLVSGFKFTHGILKVLETAHAEAAARRQKVIDPDHILLGILFRDLVLDLGPPIQSDGRPLEELPYTVGAKRVLDIALAEARALGHSYVGTEHLLMGVLGVEGTTARRVLNDAGVTPELVRAEIVKIARPSENAPGDSAFAALPRQYQVAAWVVSAIVFLALLGLAIAWSR
jgi:hypothetical protein